MKINTRTIENIKTGIIAVLSISTILLLYFFWYQTPYEKYKMTEIPKSENSIPTAELLVPKEVIVSFGEENYCVMPLQMIDFWYSSASEDYSIIDEFKKFSASENIVVEEISKEKYEVAKQFRYINAKFGFSLPFAELCDVYEIKRPSAYNSIESMTSLMYSEGSKEGMFVCDEIRGKYYWLFSDKDVTTFSKVLELIEERQHNLFYPLKTFLGGENSTLTPVVLESNDLAFHYNQEIRVADKEEIKKIAKRFFGENFDFTRNIEEESGKLIYMYGFGEQVFVVNVDGSLEYKEEFKADKYAEKKFFEALEIAVDFVTFNGGFETIKGTELTPYLKDAKPTNGKEGYLFTFGLILNGNELYYKEGEILQVEIIGSQITSYRRDIVDYDAASVAAAEGTQGNEVLAALDMLTQNYEYIYQAMVETDSLSEEEMSVDSIPDFEEIAAGISGVKNGYMRDDVSGNIRPAWILTVGNARIFFDLYTYAPIYFSKVVK